MVLTSLSRRRFIVRGAAFSAVAPIGLAQAHGALDAAEFGLRPGLIEDQSTALQAALHAARDRGQTLHLPAGHYFARNLDLPAGVRLVGQPGATALLAWANNPVIKAYLANNAVLEGITFSGGPAGMGGEAGLVDIDASLGLRIVDCSFIAGAGSGISTTASELTITDCHFAELGVAGIFSRNGRGHFINGNRIASCGNGGILLWRDEPGTDGSIVTGNRIADIAANGGGNGQNGNGINVFRAGGVILADNHMQRCAFSAVRLNATADTQVRGNTCLGSGEVAIFSEFGFSGSVIADNIVDGAAGGISMTNFNEGGRLAVCSGNLVRNIAPLSLVNPDTTPFGIFAEADAVLSGNVVEACPGLAIGAGWGPFLRDVSVTGNLVRDCEIGIGVSVAEGAGAALVTNNLVTGARRAAIAALAWTEIVSSDLESDAARFPQLKVSGNSLR